MLPLLWDDHAHNDPQWSPDGTALAFTTQVSHVDPLTTRLPLLNLANGAMESLTSGGTIHDRYPRWAPDGKMIYFLSDRSGFDEIWRLDLWTGRQEQLTPPTGQDKHGEFSVSSDGRTLAYIRVRRSCHDLEIMTVGTGPQRLNDFDGVCRWPFWSPSGRAVVALVGGPHRPPELAIFETHTGRVAGQTTCSPVPRHRASVKMVSFGTFDDREIDAVLYAAEGRPLEHDRPAIVNIHGGPNAQYLFDYDPYVERLAEEGFVILAPNCRGSTGYGRAFVDLNLRDWGGGDFRDWIAASEWLKRLDGIAPARMALWGRSYGGYATLLALGKAPGAFCCGVCHFGPSDLARFFQDTTVRSLLVRYLGLPWQNAELYRERSPMNFVDRIAVPLLILQGADDKGMPPSQSERVVDRLRELGRPVDYVCYPGEGHGFDQPEHVHDAAERIVAFLRQQARIGR